MPTYELSLVVKHALKRPELVSAVKRTGQDILRNGGFIRTLEFLGHRDLPQRQRANEEWHTKGSYFLLKVDLATEKVNVIEDICKRDGDVIRYDFLGLKPDEEPICTLEDEMKPPAERPSVKAMIELGRQKPKFKRIFHHKTGLGFNPMHK